jgi:hypothetical protein
VGSDPIRSDPEPPSRQETPVQPKPRFEAGGSGSRIDNDDGRFDKGRGRRRVARHLCCYRRRRGQGLCALAYLPFFVYPIALVAQEVTTDVTIVTAVAKRSSNQKNRRSVGLPTRTPKRRSPRPPPSLMICPFDPLPTNDPTYDGGGAHPLRGQPREMATAVQAVPDACRRPSTLLRNREVRQGSSRNSNQQASFVTAVREQLVRSVRLPVAGGVVPRTLPPTNEYEWEREDTQGVVPQ